ncbi:MAG: gorA [Devosia sp.]|nr:gorA [Devosia sp.]
MADRYDLVVIGAGSGGVRAARIAATLGAKVAIIEEYRVGGTCVIRGCVPKKLLVYGARFSDLFEVAESFGWQVEASFDWPTLIANKDKEIDRLERAYGAGLDAAGVEVFRDRAEIVDLHTIRLVKDGRLLETETILVATGGHPRIPDIPGKELGITSNEAFHLKQLPRSILIEGGGYIAVEFATIFAGLGVATTIVYRGDCLLRGFDTDLQQTLEAGLQQHGVKLIYQTNVMALAEAGTDVAVTFSDGITAPYGAVMFATGRIPNVEGFGLREAGVEIGPLGEVVVDQYSRTNVPNIYAVGDVNGHKALTPIAIREGQAFAQTLYGDTLRTVDHSMVPTAVFSEPELGTVGLTELEAATHGDIDVYVARFRPMINTLSTRSERMLLKLITEADGGKILGCHIAGHGAAEMIQLVAIPMVMGATKGDFDRTVALHPSAAEELVTLKSPSYRYRDGKKV